jgi:quercetin dioxygenase-like cupin family protein
MRMVVVSLALLASATVPGFAQDKMVLLAGPSDVKWQPAPPDLPKGAELAVLAGDPTKSGPFVVRLKLPADYQIPAHHHSTTENVTVISGSLHAGMGDKLDKQTSKGFDPGGFVSMPANMNHFAWAADPTIIQIAAEGPFDIIYVDPANDPTKHK